MTGKDTRKSKKGTKKIEQADTRKAAGKELKPRDVAKIAAAGTQPYGGTQGGSGYSDG